MATNDGNLWDYAFVALMYMMTVLPKYTAYQGFDAFMKILVIMCGGSLIYRTDKKQKAYKEKVF